MQKANLECNCVSFCCFPISLLGTETRAITAAHAYIPREGPNQRWNRGFMLGFILTSQVQIPRPQELSFTAQAYSVIASLGYLLALEWDLHLKLQMSCLPS